MTRPASLSLRPGPRCAQQHLEHSIYVSPCLLPVCLRWDLRALRAGPCLSVTTTSTLPGVGLGREEAEVIFASRYMVSGWPLLDILATQNGRPIALCLVEPLGASDTTKKHMEGEDSTLELSDSVIRIVTVHFSAHNII